MFYVVLTMFYANNVDHVYSNIVDYVLSSVDNVLCKQYGPCFMQKVKAMFYAKSIEHV